MKTILTHKYRTYLMAAAIALVAILAIVIFFRLRSTPQPYLVTETPEYTTVYLETDMGGRILRIGGWQDQALTWHNAHHIADTLNMGFETVLVEYGELMTSLASGFADIVMLPGNMALSAMVSELIVPIDPLLLSNLQLSAYGLGQGWSFTSGHPTPEDVALGVNLNILSAIGTTTPEYLTQHNRLTWDEMYYLMGVAVENGYFGVAGYPADMLAHLIGSNGGSLVNETGQFALDTSYALGAVRFMATVLREGLWEPHLPDTIGVGNWIDNLFQFQQGNALFFPIETWMIESDLIPFDFATVPFPQGSDGDTGHTWMSGWRTGFVISASTTWDVADILTIMEALLLPQENTPFAEGAVDIGLTLPEYRTVLTTILEDVLSTDLPPHEIVRSHRGYFQNILDQFLGTR